MTPGRHHSQNSAAIACIDEAVDVVNLDRHGGRLPATGHGNAERENLPTILRKSVDKAQCPALESIHDSQ